MFTRLINLFLNTNPSLGVVLAGGGGGSRPAKRALATKSTREETKEKVLAAARKISKEKGISVADAVKDIKKRFEAKVAQRNSKA